jgi:ferredoxin
MDGDYQEEIPYFQYWWDQRIDRIYGSSVADLRSHTEAFVAELAAFREDMGEQYAGPLSRQEIEGEDAAVVSLLRSLKDAGYDVSFWEPGPTAEQLNAWLESCNACQECDECPQAPPAGYDEIDEMILFFQEFGEYAQAIEEQKIGQLASTWRSWVSNFYDPEGSDDYYDLFNEVEVISKVQHWQSEIESVRNQLPECNYGNYDQNKTCTPCASQAACAKACITQWPCKSGFFATVDEDLEDEFEAAQAALSSLISDVEQLRAMMEDYYTNMDAISNALSQRTENPLTYEWTDSLGDHSIRVEVGDFKVPWVKREKHGGFFKKKVCLKLQDYSDDGRNTWVSIERTDPQNTQVGNLGFWNRPGSGTVRRMSRAAFSYDYVELRGIH